MRPPIRAVSGMQVLRDNDLVAFIACFDIHGRPQPADQAVFFTVRALRESVDLSRLGPPKSASEGAERDRIWPATIPSRDGTVLNVTADRIAVQMNSGADRPARLQIYMLRGKTAYVSPGDRFTAKTTILAGVLPAIADLRSYLQQRYTPFDDLSSADNVDRYAAVKALRFRDDPRDRVIRALENLLTRETEERVSLEAAGSAVALGSGMGQDRLTRFIWQNDRPELRMEAVFILTELGYSAFARDQLTRIATHPAFYGDEIRQAAVWGLGKAGLKCYEDILPFIDDVSEEANWLASQLITTDIAFLMKQDLFLAPFTRP